ncbi:MAG: hypothetical protein PHI73_03365 [Patescibacteria group bacterium]|nr:hypothetical protein [Patescibacteria group bacterium]
MFIDAKEADATIEYVRHLLNLITKLPENDKPGRRGVYLCVREQQTGLVVLLMPFGQFEDNRFADGCFDFAQEKTMRLLGHPDHISSWQSRSPDLRLWGGGIVCPNVRLIVALSGLTEAGDEALAVTLAYKMNWLSNTQAGAITTISGNRVTPALLTALHNSPLTR